jgi:hypothetical protein
MKEVEIKGQAIRTYLQVVRAKWGTVVEEDLICRLPAELGYNLKHGGVVSAGWYPVAFYRELYSALFEVLPNEPELPQTMGLLTAQKDLSGIYRFVLKLTSPEMVARHIDRIMGTFMRGGETSIRVGQGEFDGYFCGWHGFNRAIWTEISVGGRVVLEATGARRMTTSITEHGAGAATIGYRW